MIQAVFIDYMGTLVSESSTYAEQVIGRCFTKSGAKSPQEVAAFWFGTHDELLARSSGPDYRTEHDISTRTFELAMEHYGFTDDVQALCALLGQHWMNAPAFSDTVPFFNACPVPIYLVTSTDTAYVEAAMEHLGLRPAGIISSQKARFYKPHREIFDLALRESGCRADEVVHIGDSMRADVEGARNAGITPWLLDREGRYTAENLNIISSLREALERLGQAAL